MALRRIVLALWWFLKSRFCWSDIVSCQSSDHFHPLGACIHQSPCPTDQHHGPERNSQFCLSSSQSSLHQRLEVCHWICLFLHCCHCWCVDMFLPLCFSDAGSCTDTVKCMNSEPGALMPIEDVKNTRRGGWIEKIKSKGLITQYFYPGLFDLKLLQSTRQGDFASLQRGLNPLFSKYYNSYFNIC